MTAQSRNRIVRGGRLGLTEKKQDAATWFISRWLSSRVLQWFAEHPGAELAELDTEIAAVTAQTPPTANAEPARG